jgi:hypothetical protein
MRKRWTFAVFVAAAAAGLWLPEIAVAQEMPAAAPAKKLSDVAPRPGLPRLTPTSNGHSVHIMPTVHGRRALALAAPDPGPLVYHAGGSIMPSATLYAIYWIPRALQTGQPTTLSTAYQNLQTRYLTDYAGHALANITTEYYQIVGSTPSWSSSADGLGGVYVDTSPYPASGCTDYLTPGNCITDAQIQAEIQKVMGAKGWTGGLNKIFLLYTSSGEGSCVPTPYGPACAYTDYCGYHSFISGSPNIIYANIPYGDLSNCAAGQPSPNGDAVADSVTSTASHEVTEAITDPLLNAWFTEPLGNEIGDLCAYDYGINTWPAQGPPFNANQRWNGHSYELQREFDNHSFLTVGFGCRLVGPF